MIVSIRNSEGFVVAYSEFEVVDNSGKRVENSDYLFIRKLWIHSQFRDFLLGSVIKKIWRIIKHKGCKYVYWERSKYGFKISKTYSIKKFLKGVI